MADRCPDAEVCASNTQLDSLNKQHLDFLEVYDRSMVSLGRKIGKGGQGCVYEAKLHLPYSFKPHPVVAKKFKPFVGVSQGHFPREMFSLKSFNLCVPFGVFFEGDSLCMIMSRFSCDLRAAIDSRMKALGEEGFGTNVPPFTELDRRLIILQLAMGLKFLHECGVYHGDLKAANILLRTFGKFGKKNETSRPAHIVIADFETTTKGSAFWRAPEVFRSLRTNIPLSQEQWLLADVYSFGMVCYEVLTGIVPFEGHRLGDYDLVLNGGRPKLPDHVPQYWRDLILKCWHADPHSRPSWTEILEVLTHHDDSLFSGDIRSYFDNLVSVESLSLESLIHESKRLVRDLTARHESDSKSFRSEFMPYYWASKFLATAEEFASKTEADFYPEEGPLMCSVQKYFDWAKLVLLLGQQVFGNSCCYLQFHDLVLEQRSDMEPYLQEIVLRRDRLQGMVSTIFRRGSLEYSRVKCTEEFEVGTLWTGKLLYFHALVKWFLWNECAADGRDQEFMMKCLVPTHWSLDTMREALLIFLCMTMNAYIYVLAMISYEPILLGLQYGLYKIKGCNNILYRSSGERICRFQRAWMNCTRYSVVSITLSFSFVSLFAMYGWRGILGWILFPCIIIYTPYWRQPIVVGL